MFMWVWESKHYDKILINVNNIASIHEGSNTILVNGTHGDGNGLYHLDDKSMEILLKNIDIINDNVDNLNPIGSEFSEQKND